jgi:hypothetical protein
VQIDVVGADRAPIAKKLLFVGSVKCRANQSHARRHAPSTSRQST